jgi:succinate-semialdehyde dehydrogenase / glutarate-semialdehyde dehydrogenase
MIFSSINPYDQSLVAEYETYSVLQVEAKLRLAELQFAHWRSMGFSQRGDLFLNLAKLMRRESVRLATLITLEMGKPIAEAEAEVEKCASCCEYYAQRAEALLHDEPLGSPTRGYVSFQSLGAVFAVMPWNFPFWQVFRYAVPTVMAGNVTLLKHAPNVCGCALAMEQLFKEAGFPEGVFQTLVMDVDMVEKIIASPIVQGVTLTGSEQAGAKVAALAGKHIKKSVLELGGSDPFIVLSDADLDKAAEMAIKSRMQNAGQSCIAAKRFLVVESAAEAFAEKFANLILQLKQGNPMEKSTTLGPVARLDLADKLEKQFRDSVGMGAVPMLGGMREGCNVAPMLLADVPLHAPAMLEETFGPLVAMVKVKDEAEAVQLANHTTYGLGASVWTQDLDKARQIAAQLEAGMVFVNDMVKSQPDLPFGGIKNSGYGRELSHFGIREFVNVKVVVV